jgi:hypothetical protein
MLLTAAQELSPLLKVVVAVLLVLLFAALALLAHVFPLWLAKRAEERVLEQGRSIGIALRAGVGLAGTKPDRPCALGQVGGWHVRWAGRIGRHESEKWQVMLPAPTPVHLILGLEPVGFGSGFLKSLAGDIEVGVPEFDNAFQLVSETPQLIMHVLTPEVRNILVRHRHLLKDRNIMLRGSVIESARAGVELDPQVQKQIIELLLTLAQHVTRTSARRTGSY